MNWETDNRVRQARAYTGWNCLLPADPGRRVLCLDAGDGRSTLAVAEHCPRVVAVPLNPGHAADIADLAHRAAMSGVAVRSDLRSALQLGPFDGVVAMLVGSWRSGLGSAAIRRQLVDAIEATDPDFVLIAAINSWMRRSHPVGFRAHGASELLQLAGGDSRDHSDSWALRLNEDHPHEIVRSGDPSGEGLVDRLKRGLLAGAAGQVLAPGHIVVTRRQPTPLLCERVMADVASASGDSTDLVRQLTLIDKTVLVSAPAGGAGGAGGVVVVVPATLLATARREREFDLLRCAWSDARLPEGLRNMFPRPVAAGTTRGHRWFAVERIAGSFVDTPVPELDELTTAAADLLTELHVATRREVRCDAGHFARLVTSLLESAGNRHPACRAELARLGAQLEPLLAGRSLPLVWMHGDYKIENVAMDRGARRPMGVIDWELGVRDGFPLLDLEYLLIYNRMLRTGVSFARACQEFDSGRAGTGLELELQERYVEAVGIDPELRPVLRALLILHAAGERLHFDLEDPRERAQLVQLLRIARNRLDACTERRHGGAA